MTELKIFEILNYDKNNEAIPVLAVKLDKNSLFEMERNLLNFTLKGEDKDANTKLVLINLLTENVLLDPYTSDDKSQLDFYLYVSDNFDSLLHGQVIDLLHISGEVNKPRETVINKGIKRMDKVVCFNESQVMECLQSNGAPNRAICQSGSVIVSSTSEDRIKAWYDLIINNSLHDGYFSSVVLCYDDEK